MHKDWYDAQLQVPRIKTRWTSEEVSMMARKEAELTRLAAPPRFMNQELLRFFPDRTLEAIKGRRRRPDYHELVRAYQVENDTSGNNETTSLTSVPLDDVLMDHLQALRRPRVTEYKADMLHEIIQEAKTIGKVETLQKLALYLREVFPASKYETSRKRRNVIPPPVENKKKARRRKYAVTQESWKRNRKRCIGNILGGCDDVSQPPRNILEPYWSAVMRATTNCTLPSRRTESKDEIWAPISETDLKWGRVPSTSAAGPDGVSPRLLKSVPSAVILRIFNLLLWCGELPGDLLKSRTIFLPKKDHPENPGDFRPITIPPVLVRSLHKILAKRMETTLDIDVRQRAFRSADGCADNTFLLDTLLRAHRRKFQPLHMASLDVSKAFDSVSHDAIEAALTNIGVPAPMVRYLARVYQGSLTYLEGDGWTSAPIHPQRGVRQGDPLSPIIFNIVMNQLLRGIPDDIGVRIGGTLVNAVAFADDLLLFASTPAGLQHLINDTAKYLQSCGMTINSAKSLTLSIISSPHLKKTAVDAEALFTCDGQRLQPLKRSDEWKYLGVYFTPEGRSRCRPVTMIRPLLEALTRAPLKPQQRLFALRTVVIPKLYHQLSLGAVTIGALNKTDKILRDSTRRWLSLPHDVPTAYFHTAVRDGGLGIPSVRWTAPLGRRGRLLAASKTHFQEGFTEYFKEEIDKCTKRLTDHGRVHNTAEIINKRWRDKLYMSVDGGGFKDSHATPHQHQWIADATKFLSGKDYINCNRLRISALPTRSRTARGRTVDRRCRAGCTAQETLNHVLQHCHRTHAWRIRRHDAVLNYMERRIHSGGYTIYKEPHYHTAQGLRKPDMVAILGQTAIVVDAQVVSEQTDLETAHRRKTEYYSTAEMLEAIRIKHQVQTIRTTSATLSWKGVWSPTSASELRQLGFISTGDLKIISNRVLIGGLAEFRIFNAVTSWRWRTGVG